MKVIYNNIIPFKGYKAIMLFGLLFVRKGFSMKEKDMNHEAIHVAQMKELLYVGFYVLYVLEWLLKLLYYWNGHKAYRAISFEREAYGWEYSRYYLQERRHYAWTKYIIKKRKQYEENQF